MIANFDPSYADDLTLAIPLIHVQVAWLIVVGGIWVVGERWLD
jgi:hypothetical protein